MKWKLWLIIIVTLLCSISYGTIIKYRVNRQRCISCRACVDKDICPVNAISFINGKAMIDQSKCIGCGICEKGNQINYRGCPSDAFESRVVTRKNKPVTPPTVNQQVVLTKKDATPVINSVPAKTGSRKGKKGAAPSETQKLSKKKGYTVDQSACIGCQLCVSNCPVQAITMTNGKAVIDQSKCIQCGICVNGNNDSFAGCPVKAISFK